eukprot:UN01469
MMLARLALLIALFCVALQFTNAYYAIDLAEKATVSQMRCFRETAKGTLMIIRGWRSLGSVDPNLVSNWNNALGAGYTADDISVYMFPCPKCSASLTSQFNSFVSYMKSNNVKPHRIWLDVEGANYWTGNQSTNRAKMDELLKAARASGHLIGIYSSYYQWEDIFGLSYKIDTGNNLILWYAHYDGVENCNSFKAFGGWSKATLKQFYGDKTSPCGFDHDKSVSC